MSCLHRPWHQHEGLLWPDLRLRWVAEVGDDSCSEAQEVAGLSGHSPYGHYDRSGCCDRSDQPVHSAALRCQAGPGSGSEMVAEKLEGSLMLLLALPVVLPMVPEPAG